MFSLVASAAFAGEICAPNKDTSLFADASMRKEDRMVFQFDGVQFVPERKDGATIFGWAYDLRMQQLLETQSYARKSDWDCQDTQDVAGTDAAPNNATKFLVYDVSAEACQQDLTETRLQISQQAFAFYESSCDIKTAAAQGDATAYTLSCAGEGDTWDIQALLSPANGSGITLTIDGNSTDYVDCSQ